MVSVTPKPIDSLGNGCFRQATLQAQVARFSQIVCLRKKSLRWSKACNRRCGGRWVLDSLMVGKISPRQILSHVCWAFLIRWPFFFCYTPHRFHYGCTYPFKLQTYTTNVYDTTEQRKDADTLLEIVLKEIKSYESELKVKVIAWCTDNSGDGCAMRRKLHKAMPHLIVPECWAHQVHRAEIFFYNRVADMIYRSISLWEITWSSRCPLSRQSQRHSCSSSGSITIRVRLDSFTDISAVFLGILQPYMFQILLAGHITSSHLAGSSTSPKRYEHALLLTRHCYWDV